MLERQHFVAMTTNPSHILIARNSRGPNNPSASLSSPTETHAAAAGIFRSSGSPPWLLEECEADDIVSELSIDSSDEAIDIEETFTKHSRFPGTVKIVVESTTFWSVSFRYLRPSATHIPVNKGRTRRCCFSHLCSSKQPSVEVGPKLGDRPLCPRSSPSPSHHPFLETRVPMKSLRL